MKNSSPTFIPRSRNFYFPGEITEAECINSKLFGIDSSEDVTNSNSILPHVILDVVFK